MLVLHVSVAWIDALIACFLSAIVVVIPFNCVTRCWELILAQLARLGSGVCNLVA